MSDERYKLRSANVIVLTFAFVSREIFWRNRFAPPCLLRTGGGRGANVPPPLPFSYATVKKTSRKL